MKYMKFSLSAWVMVFFCFSHCVKSTEVEVSADVAEIDPSNIGASKVCIEFKVEKPISIAAKIRVPSAIEGREFSLFMVIIHNGNGESTTMETTPVDINNFRSISISSVRASGTVDDVEIQAVYTSNLSDPLVQIIRLRDFSSILQQSRRVNKGGLQVNCG